MLLQLWGDFFLDKNLWFKEPNNRLETSGLRVLTLGLPWHSVWSWAVHLISFQTLWCLIAEFSRSFSANKGIWNHSLFRKGGLHLISLWAFNLLSPFAHLTMLRISESPGIVSLETPLTTPPLAVPLCVKNLPRSPNYIPKYKSHKSKLCRMFCNSVSCVELGSALDFTWLL